MAGQKTYTKGAARKAWEFSRYINRYELDQPGNPDSLWDSSMQAAAAAILTNCNLIKAHIPFRDNA